jgi:hypothetical protein
VLPEDDADRELANGFILELDWSPRDRIKVLHEAGGWRKVLDIFQSVHVAEMDHWPERFMVLLIDCDGHEDRLEELKAAVPKHLSDRVFILGVLTEPEDLKPDLGPALEEIGSGMAKDCRENTDAIWGHRLLRHNASEVERLRKQVRAILFPSD